MTNPEIPTIDFFSPDPRVTELEDRMKRFDEMEAAAITVGIISAVACVTALAKGKYTESVALLGLSATTFRLSREANQKHEAAEHEILFPAK